MPDALHDRPNNRPWPPIVYAIALAAAWVLERYLPLPSLPESLLLRWLGSAVFLAAAGFALAGVFQLRGLGTPIDPTAPAEALATDGVYAMTRNPLYLAAVIGFAALGLAFRSTWLLLAVPLVAVALQKLAIEPEEAYLLRRFGESYRRYEARVRRWI